MTTLIKLPMEPCFEFKFFKGHMVGVVAYACFGLKSIKEHMVLTILWAHDIFI
jgi:hypothetical protein